MLFKHVAVSSEYTYLQSCHRLKNSSLSGQNSASGLGNSSHMYNDGDILVTSETIRLKVVPFLVNGENKGSHLILQQNVNAGDVLHRISMTQMRQLGFIEKTTAFTICCPSSTYVKQVGFNDPIGIMFNHNPDYYLRVCEDHPDFVELLGRSNKKCGDAVGFDYPCWEPLMDSSFEVDGKPVTGWFQLPEDKRPVFPPEEKIPPQLNPENFYEHLGTRPHPAGKHLTLSLPH